MPENRCSKLRRALAPLMCLSLGMALVGCAGPASQNRLQAGGTRTPGIEREDVTFPIEKGIRSVEIENRHGEITIRNRDRLEIGIHGVIQQLPPDFGRARVVSSRNGDVLRLVVELPPDTQGGRYDMAAYIPSGMSLVVNGGVDRVDVRKRAAALTVTTTSGSINASSSAHLELASGSGAIKAVALGESWLGRSHIRSTSGRIIVVAPLSGDVSLNAETGGRLSTDFGLSVHPRPGGGHSASARYGAGTSELLVSSESGEVILEQAVLLEEDNDSSVEAD